MNEPEYERTFDANDELDQHDYVWYLWTEATQRIAARERSLQREQSVPQRAGKQPTWDIPKEFPLRKEETLWYCFVIGGYTKTRAGEPVSERVLRATGTQASDWTQGQGPRPREQEAEGSSKGLGALALQRLLETMQGGCDKSIFDLPAGAQPYAIDITFTGNSGK